jgi:rod shape-determining protein MreD
MNEDIKITIQFIILVLAQVLLFNNIRLFGYLNPIIYIVFIFVYPLKKEKGFFLFLSFLLGISIDVFTDSGGSNAAATLLIAFIRLSVIKIIESNSDIDLIIFNIKKLSFIQSVTYIFLLTSIHHLFLFFLEYYKTKDIISILTTSLQTSIFSTIIIGFILQLTVKSNIHE